MISPADTSWPPKRFTPRRLELESRPLRELPPAFLCAICLFLRPRQTWKPYGLPPKCGDLQGERSYPCSHLPLDSGDLDFSELLPVALVLGVVLATAQLENGDLVVLAVREHLGAHAGAGHERRADFDRVALAHGQHLVEHQFRPDFAGQVFNLEL